MYHFNFLLHYLVKGEILWGKDLMVAVNSSRKTPDFTQGNRNGVEGTNNVKIHEK